MSAYRFNEGSIELPLERYTDRTANILILGQPETSQFNLTISRDRLREGEDLAAYVTRQIELMAKNIKGHTVQQRGPVSLGSADREVPGEFIDATHPSGGKTFFQRQAAFPLGAPFDGQVLVFSVTQDRPFAANFQGEWEHVLGSFRPRS